MYSILYVDDEPGLLEIAKLFLEKSKEFSVDIHTSAQAALNSSVFPSYDAIVSDYQMPGMDGIAFLKVVRERYRDIPFILFTGRGREEVVIEAINNGADFYLQKGGDPRAQFAELMHKIRQALARRQAERSLVESEKQLTDLVNFLPDATFAIDRSGKVITWNRAIEEMTGVSAADMLGKGEYEYAIPFYGIRRKILIDLIFEPDEIIAQNYAHIFHDKDILIADTTLPRPKGRTVTLMGKASPLYNRQGEIVGAIESIRDVTELKKAEDALRQANVVVENSPVVLFRWKAEEGWPVAYVSQNIIQFGYFPEELLSGVVPYSSIVHPDDLERVAFEVQKYSADGTDQFQQEYRIVTRDRQIRWIDDRTVIERDTHGQITHYQGIVIDITDRKRTQDELRAAYEQITASEEELRAQYEALARSEKNLRESETEYCNILRTAMDGFCIIDMAGSFVDVNDAFCTLLGYTREEALTLSLPMVEFRENREETASHIREIIRRGEDRFETKFRRKDGRIIDVEVSVVYTKTHGGRFLTFSRDINGRKKTEEALRESGRQLQEAQEMAHLGFWTWDVKTGQVDWSDEVFRIFGLDPKEFTPQIDSILALSPWPEEQQRGMELIRKATESREPGTYEQRFLRPDKSIGYYYSTFQGRYDDSGNLISILGTVLDITDRKKVETELRATCEQLTASEKELRRQYEALALSEQRIRESEIKFRAIIDHSFEFIGLMTPDGTLIEANESALAFIGFSGSDVLNRPFWETPWWTHSPELQEDIREGIKKAAAGEMVRFEVTSSAADGHLAYIDFSIKPVLDAAGRILYLIPEGRDITDRKHAEEALRTSEKRFRAIFDKSHDALLLFTAEGCIDCNQKALALFGYELRKDLLGMNHTIVSPQFQPDGQDSASAAKAHIRTAHEKGSDQFEWLYRKKDGSTFLAEILLSTFELEGTTIYLATVRDITERKRTEDELSAAHEQLTATEQELRKQFEELALSGEQLRESEEKFRALVETTSDFMWEVDEAGRYTYASPKIRDLLGYEPEEVIGKTPFDLMLPDEAQRISEEFGQLVALRLPISALENRNLHKNGSVVILETSGVPRYANDGTFTGYRGIDRDITGRKRAEQALEESEKRFRSLVRNSYDCITVFQADGTIMYESDSLYRLFGYHPEDVVGRNAFDLVHPDDLAEAKAKLLDLLDHPDMVFNAEYRFLHADGSWVDVECVGTNQLSDPAIRGIVLNSRVITDRKMAEKALHVSEKRLQLALEAANDGLFDWDMENGTAYFSPRYFGMLGYLPDELPSSYDTWVDLLHPDDRDRALSVISQYHSGTRESHEMEFRLRTKNGDWKWILSRGKISGRDASGRPARMVGTHTDITDRKMAEEALRESEEKYRTLVEQSEDGVVIVQDERIVFANRALSRMIGYLEGELLGHSVGEFIAPEDLERVMARHRERMTGRDVPLSYEYSLLHKDDRSRVMTKMNAGTALIQGKLALIATFHDVTKEREREEAIRESEARLSSILHGSPVLQFVIDRNHKIISWNKAIEEYSGIKAAEILGTDQQWRAFYQEKRPVLADLLVDGRTDLIPELYAGKFNKSELVDGAYEATDFFPHMGVSGIWLHFTAAPVVDADGTIIGSIETLEDITERRKAEEALKKSEEQYKHIFESYIDIYYETDRNSLITVLSPSVYAMSGWKPEELIGKPVEILYVNPSDRQVLLERLKREKAVYGFEVSLKKQDGTPIPVSINARIRYTAAGGPDGISGSIRDITDDVKARRNLEESEQRYRSVIENIQDAFIRTDRGGRIIMASPSAASLTGYGSADEMIGLPVVSLYRFPEEREALMEMIRLEKEVRDYQVEFRKKDGSAIWVSISAHLLYDEQGDYLGSEGIIRDISERRNMENAIREANRKLNLLNSVTRHDVANQLTALRGYTQIAGIRKPEPVIADLLSKIDAAAGTIANQIEFTKIYQEMGLKAPAWSRIDEVVAKAGNRLVKFSNTCRSYEIFADPMLERVFFNLFDNAARHGEKVTEITVRCERAAGGFLIIVEDNGIGIPSGEKEKIFEKGFGKNTGFGLFLAKEVLSLTGITIRESGILNKGARFEILVPKGLYRFVPQTVPPDKG